MPKKIARDIARQVKQLGEEVVEEFKDLPGGMAREAGKQIGMLPRGWGEEEREAQLSTRMMQEKEEERRKKLTLARKRIKELEARKPESEEVSEEVKKQKKIAEEAERVKPLEEPETKKPRGLPPGAKRRIEKRRGTHELKAGL